MNQITVVDSTSVDRAIMTLERICAAGGPELSEHGALAQAIDVLHQYEHGTPRPLARPDPDRAIADRVFDRYPRVFRTPQTLQGLAWAKPRGYAGDFEMIRKIYRNYRGGDPEAYRWDTFFQAGAAPAAVRNRGAALLAALDTVQVDSILSIGAGPGLDVAEALAHRPTIRHVSFLDADALALEAARVETERFGKGRTFDFLHRNALWWYPDRTYGLVWSSGLFDYLEDRVAIALLERLKEAVAADGAIVIGNFSRENPSRAYMESVGRWYLIHRGPGELANLLSAAGFDNRATQIWADATGVNLFALSRPAPPVR